MILDIGRDEVEADGWCGPSWRRLDEEPISGINSQVMREVLDRTLKDQPFYLSGADVPSCDRNGRASPAAHASS